MGEHHRQRVSHRKRERITAPERATFPERTKESERTMKSELIALREKIFDEYERKIKPLYPRILVRVLGKEVKFGDHILHPHWAGDQKGLRLEEGDVRFLPEDQIVAVLEYTRKPGEVPVA